MKPPKKKAALPNGYLPFPVLMKAPATTLIPKIRGYLTKDCNVIVTAPGDMALLYNMGFFGKGTLSKHEPVFHRIVEQPVDLIKQHIDSVSMERYTMAATGDLRSRPINVVRVCPDNMISKLDSIPAASVYQESTTPDIQTVEPINPVDDSGMSCCEDELHIGSAVIRKSVEKEEDFSWTEGAADEDFWSSDRLPQFDLPENVGGLNYTPIDSTEIIQIAQEDMTENPTLHAPLLNSSHGVDTVLSDRDMASDTSSDGYLYSDDDEACISVSRLDIHDTGEDKSEYVDLKEDLQLDSYEAMFLMLSFGCLMITDDSGVNIDYHELWCRCLTCDKQFLPRYAVYHHIRAKGWIPKDGLTYGCNFVVYKRGPKYYHSSLGVLVRCVNAATTQEVDEYSETKLSWSKILGLNRVMNNVRKELMICYILMPPGLTEAEIKEHPVTILKRLNVCETLVNRVIPSREVTASSTTLRTINAGANNSAKQ